MPYTQPTVNKHLKRTNQVQKNRGNTKVRQSKTPAAITSLKNNVVIENEDKDNQNPSGGSKRISFPSPNSKEKIQPEDSNNIKHIKVERKISWLCGDKILCLHTIKRKSIKVEEYLHNISSSCPNLAVQVLNKLLSQQFFEEEVDQ